MDILRLLMADPATLTQLAKTLHQSPAWVRHHILALESADLIELAEVRITGKVTEKFYRAKAGAFLVQELILPEGTNRPSSSPAATIWRSKRSASRSPTISPC